MSRLTRVVYPSRYVAELLARLGAMAYAPQTCVYVLSLLFNTLALVRLACFGLFWLVFSWFEGVLKEFEWFEVFFVGCMI